MKELDCPDVLEFEKQIFGESYPKEFVDQLCEEFNLIPGGDVELLLKPHELIVLAGGKLPSFVIPGNTILKCDESNYLQFRSADSSKILIPKLHKAYANCYGIRHREKYWLVKGKQVTVSNTIKISKSGVSVWSSHHTGWNRRRADLTPNMHDRVNDTLVAVTESLLNSEHPKFVKIRIILNLAFIWFKQKYINSNRDYIKSSERSIADGQASIRRLLRRNKKLIEDIRR